MHEPHHTLNPRPFTNEFVIELGMSQGQVANYTSAWIEMAYAKTHEMGLFPKPLFLYENQRFSKSFDFHLHICKKCDILISQAWTKSLR